MPRRRAYCDWSNWTRNWTDFNLEYRLLQRLVVNMFKPQALILSGSGSAQHHLTIAFIPIANFECENIGADVILRI